MTSINLLTLAVVNPTHAMSFGLDSLAASAFEAMSTVQPVFAVGIADLKDKLRQVLDLVMIIGFLYGTVRIIGGANQIRRGETEEGKQAILAGALIAAAPMIMRVLFSIFIGSDAGL